MRIFLTQYLFWYPDFSFINDMRDLPTSFVEFSCNPFPVTFPREAFRTDNDRGFIKGKRFKEVDSLDKILSAGVGRISAFPETTKFLSEEMVLQFFALQEGFEIFPSKNRELAFGETTHIDEGLDVVRKEDFYEILFSSPISSEGIYLFHLSLSYHFFLDKLTRFGLKLSAE